MQGECVSKTMPLHQSPKIGLGVLSTPKRVYKDKGAINPAHTNMILHKQSTLYTIALSATASCNGFSLRSRAHPLLLLYPRVIDPPLPAQPGGCAMNGKELQYGLGTIKSYSEGTTQLSFYLLKRMIPPDEALSNLTVTPLEPGR